VKAPLASRVVEEDERGRLVGHGRGETGEEVAERARVVREAVRLDTDERGVGRVLDAIGVRARERRRLVPRADLDRADRLPRATERHGEDPTVLREHRAARAGGLARAARSAPGSARPTSAFLRERLGCGEDELVAVRVVEEEGEALRGRERLDPVEHGTEDFRKLQGRREGAERFVDGGELLELASERPVERTGGHASR
jgi:hypothetical protein